MPFSWKHPRPSLQTLVPRAERAWHGGKETDLRSDPGSATSCVALDTLLNLSGLHFFTSPVGIAPPSLLGGWADSVDWCQSACWTAKTRVESLTFLCLRAGPDPRAEGGDAGHAAGSWVMLSLSLPLPPPPLCLPLETGF